MKFLFSNVIPVKGYNRSVLLDLTRFNFELIPNNLYETFVLKNNLLEITTTNLKYIDFLNQNDFILEIDEQEENLFPKLSLEWDYPYLVSSLIINSAFVNSSLFINYLIDLNPKEVAFLTSLNDIDKLVIKLNEDVITQMSIQKVHLLFNEKEFGQIDQVQISKNPFFTVGILNEKNVVINPPTIEIYTESLNYNVFFNRKLFINEFGVISYTLNNNEVQKQNIDEILKRIKSNELNQLWTITKDKVDICCDCELRNICTDKRIPIKKNKNINSFYNKKECIYNPYISKWSHEDGYKTLEECGVISNDHEFSIDHEKIAVINKELWEDE